MYGEHFGLVSDPFSLTPDPAFLYLSPDHREALAAVQYGLLDGRGFVTLVGEVGTGKTTLLYSILGRKHAGLEAAYVSYSAQSFEDLLASALRDLKVETTITTKAALVQALNRYLLERADDNRNVALIIDEAQNLSDDCFEELRLLSNFETYTRKLLQIVLVGQPELQARLRQPGLRQLRERVSVRAHVNPLSRQEMARYIAHRLERAGGDVERLFTPRALRIIVRRTAGIPRRANILCHNALLFAFGRGRECVSHVEAREAVAEMDERRPGWLPRAALRRVHLERASSGWVAALGGAVLVGALVSRLWSPGPGLAFRSDARDEGASVALAPDSAVAATEVPEAAASVPEAAPTAVTHAEPIAPAVVAAATLPMTGPEPAAAITDNQSLQTLSVVVPRGAALWSLLRNVYGERFATFDRSELYVRVRELNPQVTDVNLIFAGDRLRLPVPPRADETGGIVAEGSPE